MTPTRSAVFRELGLAAAHASCESPAALESAVEHARHALRLLLELKDEAQSRPSRRVVDREG